MWTLLAISLLASVPAGILTAAWALSWKTRRMRPEARVVRGIFAVALLIGLPGAIVWAAAADEDGESMPAVLASAATCALLLLLVVRMLWETRARVRARQRIVEGRDVDAQIAWMRARCDRRRLRLQAAQVPQYAETTAEDAIVIAAVGRHDQATELLARAGAPAVLAMIEYEQTLAALRALHHLARGETDEGRALLPDDPVRAEPGRIWDVVAATSALAAVLDGEAEESLPLAAARPGERPFAGALRTLARAHAAAGKGDRDAALREIATLRATKFPQVIDRYVGPATQLARAEGPYRG